MARQPGSEFEVGMYLRTTKRRNNDGSEVRYVQLAHNRRVDGVTRAEVLVNLGREEQLDREALRRLAQSISRYLGDPEPTGPDGLGARIVGARPLGLAWVVEGLWDRLGLGTTVSDALTPDEGAALRRAVVAAVLSRGEPAPVRHSEELRQAVARSVLEHLGAETGTVFVDADGDPALAVTVHGFPVTPSEVPEARAVAVHSTVPSRSTRPWLVATPLSDGTAIGRQALARPGRYRIAPGNLRVKEIQLDRGGKSRRWIICHDRFDRKSLLVTTLPELSAGELAYAHHCLLDARARIGSDSDTVAWVALLLVRAAEYLTGRSWPELAAALKTIAEVMFESDDGPGSLLTPPSADQGAIYEALGVEPPTSGPEPEPPADVAPGAPARPVAPERGRASRRAPRRAPGEGRQMLLEAARELFSERGYSGTSAREIAERAGIAETLLFRNFGSKAALFGETVLGPIRELAAEWAAFREAGTAGWSEEKIGQEFVGRFYDRLREDRRLIISYIAASAVDPDILPLEAAPIFLETLSGMVEWARESVEEHELSWVNGSVAGPALIGMILSMAIFDDWLRTGAEPAPTRGEIIDEMVQLMRHGVTRRTTGRSGR